MELDFLLVDERAVECEICDDVAALVVVRVLEKSLELYEDDLLDLRLAGRKDLERVHREGTEKRTDIAL